MALIAIDLDTSESSSVVEHHLAKVRVAGSNPVFRSTKSFARVVELVDTLDLKSNDHCGRAGSSPASSTRYFLAYLSYPQYLLGVCCFTTILIPGFP